jgi:hypothetical protein
MEPQHFSDQVHALEQELHSLLEAFEDMIQEATGLRPEPAYGAPFRVIHGGLAPPRRCPRRRPRG